ncbi:MAG: site-specific integrase, partial [Hyphomicrobiales bacterium]|nr:site-specific integrase [Hyphomicrobiales bacterium]
IPGNTRAAWRTGNRNLARFILIGLYSGTRHDAILTLQWHPNTTGAGFDLKTGVMHRRGSAQRRTSKRQPTVRIQRRLLPHLKRWRRIDGDGLFVINWKGKRLLK